MNTAMAVAQKRVQMPSSTLTAPTVSIAITSRTTSVPNDRAGMPLWIRSMPRLRNTPPTARRMKKAAYGVNAFTRSPLEHGHREERPQIVVRHAQPGGQEPHDGPQHLVGDVAIEVEQQLEIGSRNRDEGTGGAVARAGRTVGAVQNLHVAEAGARLHDREWFFTRARD